jgi:hypothetical protein
MRKSLAALMMGATLAVAVAPMGAQAGDRGAVAAGVIGGLAAGAIIGGAIANSAPPPPPAAYYPAPAYGPGPVYYEDAPECRIVKQRVWIEGLGYRWRNVEMCD